MDCRSIEEKNVIERYLLAQLDEAEQQEFEEHFFSCDACARELETFRLLQEKLDVDRRALPRRAMKAPVMPIWGWASGIAAVILVAVIATTWFALTTVHPPVQISQKLTELAAIEAPAYEPIRLRGIYDESQQQFRTAMEFYSTGDYVSAIPGLEEAAKLDPEAPNISFFLGACYLLSGQSSEGIATLERVVDLGDTVFLEEAHLLLAKARISGGDVDTATDHLQTVIDLDGAFADEARSLLDTLSEGVPPAD
jgi:tetratricopeptide (TPR) repeat protein